MHRSKPPVVISSDSLTVYEQIKSSENAVLCGKNNSGKSFILKKLVGDLGVKSIYLGPNRYQNFNLLSNISPENINLDQKHADLIRQLYATEQNVDNSQLNLQQAIAGLKDEKRKVLFEIIEKLLGSKMEIKSTIENNEMSQRYISVDGHNISYTSSGLRLITSIVASLLDDNYENFLIDEPELGVSPEIQGIISSFLFNRSNRVEYFPHIKKLIIATHSFIFLDKSEIKNNYHISKSGNEISISNVNTVQEMNTIQFFLLGNRFESLFLPSILIFVEGKTDYKFINSYVIRKYPDSKISIAHTNGDGRVKENIHLLKNMLGDISKGPYYDRIFVMLDEKHTVGLKKDLVDMGIKNDNIVTWDKNGIEYYYPEEILKVLYNGSTEINIEGDSVLANGVTFKKDDLANQVSDKLRGDEKMNSEFEEKFDSKLSELLF